MGTRIDDLISVSRKSSFVESVLDPSKGAVSIPDDVTQEHVLRSETVTSNITVSATGAGLFVFWPEHPTSLIGAHYTVNGSTITFDRLLRTAQGLSANFNSGRKAQQLVKLLNTTVPAGGFAISGTFNAVEFEGNLSEIDSLAYNSILSVNTDPHKKVGNVPCGQGIAVLTLPQLDVNFTRLDDDTPSTGFTSAKIEDGSMPLDYMGTIAASAQTIPTSSVTAFSASMNVDIIGATEFTFELPITSSSATAGAGLIQAVLSVGLRGLQGTNIVSFNIGNCVEYPNSKIIRRNLVFKHSLTEAEVTQPLVTMAVTLDWVATGSGGAPINATRLVSRASVKNSMRRGHNNKVSIVAYEGVATGSTITVSGISNFELIPNPGLQKNLQMRSSQVDPDESRYYKLLLARRSRLGIRTVSSLPMYHAMLADLEAYTDLDHTPQSLSFWKILRAIKSVAAPALSTIFPAAAPIIGLVDKAADALLPESASGRLYGPTSASGLLGGPYSGLPQRKLIPHSMSDVPHTRRRPPTEDLDPTGEARGFSTAGVPPPMLGSEIETPLEPQVLDISRTSSVLFPVIFTNSVGMPQVSAVYSSTVITSDILAQAPWIKKLNTVEARAPDGSKVTIYGVSSKVYPSSTLPFLASLDVALLPVLNVVGNHLTTSAQFAPVEGTSHQLAVVLAGHLMGVRDRDFSCIPGALFTGSVYGTAVGQVLGLGLKKELADSLGMPLIGNSPGLTIKAPTTSSALRFARRLLSCPSLDRTTQIKLGLGSLPVSADEDDLPPPPPAEGAALMNAIALLHDAGMDTLATSLKFLYEFPQVSEAIASMNETAREKTARTILKGTAPKSISMERAREISENMALQGVTISPEEVLRRGRGYTVQEMRDVRGSTGDKQYLLASRLKTSRLFDNIAEEDLAAWIAANGRGPTTEQMRYISKTGAMPDPGDHSPALPPGATAAPQGALDSFAAQVSPKHRDAAKKILSDYYARNLGVGPTPRDMADLNNQARALDGRAPAPNPFDLTRRQIGSTAATRGATAARTLFTSGPGEDVLD